MAAVMLVTFLIPQEAGPSYISGFLTLFLLWGGLAWFMTENYYSVLTDKMSIFIFKTDNSYLTIGATALLGAMIAGIGAILGYYFRKLIFKGRY
jgi:hypothetical protein